MAKEDSQGVISAEGYRLLSGLKNLEDLRIVGNRPLIVAALSPLVVLPLKRLAVGKYELLFNDRIPDLETLLPSCLIETEHWRDQQFVK